MVQNDSIFGQSHLFVIIVITVYYVSMIIISISYNLGKINKLESQIVYLRYTNDKLMAENRKLKGNQRGPMYVWKIIYEEKSSQD